jgi:hypothetical protein
VIETLRSVASLLLSFGLLLMAKGSLARCLACAGLALFSRQGSSTLLFVTAGNYGSISFTVYSVSAAHINDFGDKDRLIQIASGMLITYGTGASVGPVLGAVAMSLAGPGGLFIYLGTISGLLEQEIPCLRVCNPLHTRNSGALGASYSPFNATEGAKPPWDR